VPFAAPPASYLTRLAANCHLLSSALRQPRDQLSCQLENCFPCSSYSTMDPQLVSCAFKLFALLDSKPMHPFGRTIDPHTRRIITLITQSSTCTRPTRTPPPSHDLSTSTQLVLHGSSNEPNTYTRDEFKRDMEYLAEALFTAATRAPLALIELQAAIRAVLPPPAPTIAEIQAALPPPPLPPTLDEIKAVVKPLPAPWVEQPIVRLRCRTCRAPLDYNPNVPQESML